MNTLLSDKIGIPASTFSRIVHGFVKKLTMRKPAEAQLHQKNEIMKSVLESLSHPFYVINANDYTIALANSSACKKGSAEGSTCYALMHRTDKPCGTQGHMCPLEEVKKTGKPAVVEHVHYDEAGNMRDMEVHCYPIFDGGGNVVQVIEYSLDITERKRTEEGLRLHSAIIANMEEGVSLFRDRDGKIIFINPKFEKMFGYKPGELIGKHISIIHPPTDKNSKEISQEIMECLNEKGNWGGEIKNIRKNGESFWCYANISKFEHPGHGTVWISVHQDITERKQAEEALAESEEHYRTIVEFSNDMIWALDMEGRFMFFNKAAEELSGYRSVEWKGRSFVPLLRKEDLPRVIEVFQKTLSGKPQQYEVTVKRFDGSDLMLSVNSAPYYSKGKITGTVSSARDITELKMAEEIRLENERLAYATKAKSEFLTVMSHELRTPLNSIIGFSDLLAQKTVGELNSKQEHFANNILASGKHLLGLISDILDLSKVEAGKMELVIEKVPVPDLINETIILLREKAADHSVVLKKELDPALDVIEADQQRLKQIFFNLISNSIKFSKPEGGCVTITTKKEGDMGKFIVSDTGIGIKDEDLGRLFKTFEQLDSGTSRKYGGSGLGLAITKNLVELHGGRIIAESKYGAGTTFTFFLPVIVENKNNEPAVNNDGK